MKESQRMEALGIFQEECAEAIQAVSKWRRAGPDFKPRGGREPSYREQLQAEIFDVLVLIEILGNYGVFDQSSFEDHKLAKIERLKEWSGIICP